MDQLLDNFGSFAWWASVVMVGIAINLASNAIWHSIDPLILTFPRWISDRSEKRRKKFEASVALLSVNNRLQMLALFRVVRLRAIQTGLLVIAVGTASVTLASRWTDVGRQPERTSLIDLSAFVFILVSMLLASLAHLQAERLQQIAEAALDVKADGDKRDSAIETREPPSS
jgi:hypothetical protein